MNKKVIDMMLMSTLKLLCNEHNHDRKKQNHSVVLRNSLELKRKKKWLESKIDNKIIYKRYFNQHFNPENIFKNQYLQYFFISEMF